MLCFFCRACKAGNEQLVNHLLDKLNMTYVVSDSEGRTILHIAVMKKSKMRYAITKRCPEFIAIGDKYGQTLFHAACANNDIDYIKWLFDLVVEQRDRHQTLSLTPKPDVTSTISEGNFTQQISVTVEDTSNTIKSTFVLYQHENTDPNLIADPADLETVETCSSSDVPTGTLSPVNYCQYVEKMKLFAVDAKGESILHVMIKNNCHELMAYILKSWPNLGVKALTTRDFWLRATDMDSPLEEAITLMHYQCLDVMLDAIITQFDPSYLYNDDSLLLKGVCSGSLEVVKILINHGICCGLDKTLHVSACVSEVLPLVLFYKEVVGLIEDGKEYLMENSCTLSWCDYLLNAVDPVWIRLASHASEIVKELFASSLDSNQLYVIAAGKAVVKRYTELISQPIIGPIGECFTTVILSGNELTSVPVELLSLPNLKTLDLSKNQITELPNGDAHYMSYSCHSLNTLTINNNLLTTLPGKLFLLPQLEVISAQHNKIEHLPTAAWISNSLLTFNLSNNKLSRLHDLSGSQLFWNEEEDAFLPGSYDENMKLKLDTFVAQLKYLKNKTQSPNEDDESEDECGGTMSYYLKSLNLSSNKFTKVPTDLPCLAPNLEKLWLNNNPISEVDLIRDFPADLLMLNIQSCKLKSVTVTRSKSIPCGSVSYLMRSTEAGEYCEHCSHEYLAKLNTLSLKSNNIASLQVVSKTGDNYEALFPVLSVLDISNNQMLIVPDHLELLTELTSLYLSDNNITFLPSSISKLSHLLVIHVENLTLSNIPRAILSSQSATELKNYLKHLHQK